MFFADISVYAAFYKLAQILKPVCAGFFMTFATIGGLFLLCGWWVQAHRYAQGYTAQSLLGTFGAIGFPLAFILAWGNVGGVALFPLGLAPPDGALDLACRTLALRLPSNTNAVAALESMTQRYWTEWNIGGMEFLAHPIDTIFAALCLFFAKLAAWTMELVLGLRIILMSIAWAFGPLYICALAVPATRGIGTTFMMGALSVYLWPLAFGFVNAGTIAILSTLVAHALSFWDEIFAMFLLAFWVLAGYIAAPFALGVAMTSGNVVGAAGTLIGAAMGGAAAGMGAMAQKTLGAAGAAANMIPGVGPALGAGLSGLGNMAGSAGRHTGAAMHQGAHGQVYHPSFTRGGMSFGGGRGRPPTPTDGGNRPPPGNGRGTPPNNPPGGGGSLPPGGGGGGKNHPPDGGGPKVNLQDNNVPPAEGNSSPNSAGSKQNFTGGYIPPQGNRPTRHARTPQMSAISPTPDPASSSGGAATDGGGAGGVSLGGGGSAPPDVANGRAPSSVSHWREPGWVPFPGAGKRSSPPAPAPGGIPGGSPTPSATPINLQSGGGSSPVVSSSSPPSPSQPPQISGPPAVGGGPLPPSAQPVNIQADGGSSSIAPTPPPPPPGGGAHAFPPPSVSSSAAPVSISSVGGSTITPSPWAGPQGYGLASSSPSAPHMTSSLPNPPASSVGPSIPSAPTTAAQTPTAPPKSVSSSPQPPPARGLVAAQKQEPPQQNI